MTPPWGLPALCRGGVAQNWLEQALYKGQVVGSSPTAPTNPSGMDSMDRFRVVAGVDPTGLPRLKPFPTHAQAYRNPSAMP